jgi:hypothetical protein
MFYLGICEALHTGPARIELVTWLHIRIRGHPSMHGSFNRSGKSNNRIDRGWGIGFFALPVLLVIAVIGLAIIQPAAPVWISEAVQAEFVGTNLGPDIRPTQLAQPSMVVTGTVNAN